jgi:hypothetical protein
MGKSVVTAGLLLWAAYVSKSFTGVVYAPVIDQAFRTTWRYLDMFADGIWSGVQSEKLVKFRNARKGAQKAPAIELSAAHSISTKAVGQDATRVQGQHAVATAGGFTSAVHVFEEADAISDRAVFDSVKTMVGKGVALWIICLNPATATAPVQSLGGDTVRRWELSVLEHPNVKTGKDIIPGASNRAWVENVIQDWAEEVSDHDPRFGTFSLPWDPLSRIYKPHPPWYWRVLGRVPPTGGGDSAVPEALYLTACQRDWKSVLKSSSKVRATIGVDVARSYDGDSGSIVLRWAGCIRVVARIREKDTRPYVRQIRNLLQDIWERGCREVSIRIDAGGGFGGGVRDQLVDHAIAEDFKVWDVRLCDFGGVPAEPRKTKNWVTEAYLAVAKDLQELALISPPPELRMDLCGRKLRWEVATVEGGKVDVVMLESKDKFRERVGRSPDDGDAVALACWPWQDMDASWEEDLPQQPKDRYWMFDRESDSIPKEEVRWGR